MLFNDSIFLIAFRRFGKKLNFWDIKMFFSEISKDFVRFAQNVKRSKTLSKRPERVYVEHLTGTSRGAAVRENRESVFKLLGRQARARVAASHPPIYGT